MGTVGRIYEAIEAFAPFSNAEDWDNCGILVGSAAQTVTKALVALDLTDAVLEEAIDMGAQLVITHHPVIFHPMKALSAQSLPYRLAQHHMAVISAHTNLDVASGGVNTVLAERLGLGQLIGFATISKQPYQKLSVFVPETHAERVYDAMCNAGAGQLGDYDGCAFLTSGQGRFCPQEGANPFLGKIGQCEQVPEVRIEMICPPERVNAVVAAMKAAHPYELPAYDLFSDAAIEREVSLGLIGRLPNPMSCKEFAQHIKDALGCGGLKYTSVEHPIQTVAVLGGAGSEFVELAAKRGCDAFVTADTKHDRLLTAKGLNLMLVDAGHYATEHPVVQVLYERLQQELPEIVFAVSQSETDPCLYR